MVAFPSRRNRPETDYVVNGRGDARPATLLAFHAGKVKVGAAVLALAAMAPATELQSGLRSAGSAAWLEAMALVQGRSPGLRRVTRFIKGQKVDTYVRVKPRVWRRPAPIARPPFAASVPPAPIFPLVFNDAPLAPGPVDYAGLVPRTPPEEQLACLCFNTPPGPGINPITFINAPGPGGGGPGAPPVVNPPAEPPINPPGIPEPSSWMTMIMGFFGLGTMWRRRRALARLLIDVPMLRLSHLTARA